MRIAYYTHSKNIHNSKVVEFENFKNSKYVLNFQKSFTTCKWGVKYMTWKKKL